MNQNNEELFQTNEQLKQKKKEIKKLYEELFIKNVEITRNKNSTVYKLSKIIYPAEFILHPCQTFQKIKQRFEFLFDKKLINQSGLFDKVYYFTKYPDVKEVGVNPLKHFYLHGWRQGRNPCEAFNTRFYLAVNEDVKNAGINPLVHFIKFGQSKGYIAQPLTIHDKQFQNKADISDVVLTVDDISNIKIAVVCHLYYLDLADEFIAYFSNIPPPYDLYITTTSKDKEVSIRKHFTGKLPGIKTIVIAFENRGRDIYPFISLLKTHLQVYDVVCKVHSKKSNHNTILPDWRKYLLDNLLGDPLIIKKILSEFITNQQLGMVWPLAHPYFVNNGSDKSWGTQMNRKKNHTSAVEHFPELQLGNFDQNISFPVGSMFWFRPETLNLLVQKEISIVDFEEESRQLDGTLAHSLERIFGIISTSVGYQVKTAFFPQLFKNNLKK
jgi:O-antigen biosynthesis protein